VLDRKLPALSSVAQSKMLRVLQERAFERLGGTETLRIEARLIALTMWILQRPWRQAHFREDLFFRLNVLTLRVPPLREPARRYFFALADHLLEVVRNVLGRPAAQRVRRSRAILARTNGW